MEAPARIVRGCLTQCYADGYGRRAEGGPKAVLFPPFDPQGRWLYMNGVEDAARDGAVA